jgi:protein tyrosine phosphatase (PTP) superfamily phosphohydrolase (DUF442 family)
MKRPEPNAPLRPRQRLRVWLACLLLLPVVAQASPVATELAGVGNYHQVSPVLYRSAMPEAQGFDALETTPIRSIVSLRWQADPADPTPESGPRRVHIPIRTWKLTEEHIISFLKLVQDPANQPVLVHCKHGADRTGTMVAAYRIVVQGWSKEAALAEMREDRYGHHWLWKNLRNLIRDLDVERIRNEVGIKAPPAVVPAD